MTEDLVELAKSIDSDIEVDVEGIMTIGDMTEFLSKVATLCSRITQ